MEWKADLNERLVVPHERQATQKYRFALYPNQHEKAVPLTGSCAAYELGTTGVIYLTDVLIDTSARAHGITMTKRITHREQLILVNVPMTLFPMNTEELAAIAGAEKPANWRDLTREEPS